MSPSRPLTGLAAVLAPMLIAGCGVAGTSFHPGVAAQVEDETLTSDRVDEISTRYCEAIEEQLRGEGQVLPLRYVRGGVAGQLTLVAVAEQIAEEEGLATSRQYDRRIAELEQAVSTLPPEAAEAVVEVESAGTYLTEIKQALGARILAERGTEEPTQEQSAAAGQEAFTAWIAEHDVQIDPRYGVDLVDGQAVPADTGVSVAVGETARRGLAPTPDPEYAGTLPDSQRCG